MLPPIDYIYLVEVIKVIDGDTLEIYIDCGFYSWLHNIHCRLYGINTPELKGETLAQGKLACEHLKSLITKYGVVEEGRSWILMKSYFNKKKDKYGRILVDLIGGDEKGNPINLNKEMVKDGMAVEYIL